MYTSSFRKDILYYPVGYTYLFSFPETTYFVCIFRVLFFRKVLLFLLGNALYYLFL